MADKKAATITEAARALIDKAPHRITPYDAAILERLASTPMLTDAEFRDLRARLRFYAEDLALLGFSWQDLTVPVEGISAGSTEPGLSGAYEVAARKNLSCGVVNAGRGRIFFVISWGEPFAGTLILRRNSNPDCWVEVASYLDRKEPEAAVTCLLLGEGDRGTPFDDLKKALGRAEHRYWGERDRVAKSAVRESGKARKKRGGDAGRNP